MATLIRRGRIENPPSPEAGEVLRLEPADDPAASADRLGAAARVEVHFPSFTDGRGYSIARLLRERHGYRGEVRAVGDVQRDQLFYLARCGFDAFLLRDGRRAADARLLLERIASAYAPAALSSSLGAEDMVLTDLIAREGLPVEIFTLDTGRLRAETLQLADRVQSHYGIAIRVMQPDPQAVIEYVTRNGRNAFYGSVEMRKRCCEIRKVGPLKRALDGKRAWITGLRREHSAARAALKLAEFDDGLRITKFNPLAAWSGNDVWDYIRTNKVPYNPLHDRGFPSIGCEPCTRPVEPGADERSGRWWWEEEGKKECGLHVREENRGQSPISAPGIPVVFQNDLGSLGREIHPAQE